MTTLSVAARNAEVDGIAGYGSWISLHSADPGATGANEITGTGYARVQTTWAASSGGTKAGSQVTITVPAGKSISHYGVFNAVTGTGFSFGDILAAPETYGSAGTYQATISLVA